MKQSFGQLLRKYRHECADPDRGGPLTQKRLADFLAEEGFVISDVTISNWERDQVQISHTDRALLLVLIRILHRHNGIRNRPDADRLLFSGGFRSLDEDEISQINSDWLDTKPTPSTGITFSDPTDWTVQLTRKSDGEVYEVNSAWVESLLKNAPSSESSSSTSPPSWNNLTKREKEIALFLASESVADLTNAAVARQLGISVNTLRRHLRSIYNKLRVNSRAGLVHSVLKWQRDQK